MGYGDRRNTLGEGRERSSVEDWGIRDVEFIRAVPSAGGESPERPAGAAARRTNGPRQDGVLSTVLRNMR